MKSFISFWVVTLLVYFNAYPHTITHHIVENGKVWNYTGNRRIASPEYQAEWNETYSLEGDTLIGNLHCLKLYLTSDSPYGFLDHSYLGAMYEEGENVYYIASGSNESTLLYDFSCEPETIVKVNNFELLINGKKVVKYRDKYLTVIDWSPIEEEETLYHGIWIEGIGSPLDLMNNTPIWYDGCPNKELVTCKLYDQIIYDKDDFEASAQVILEQEYFPEGTKWTEIRLDTLKYDSWYSKVGDEWVPNFETVEYRVEGEHTSYGTHYKCVYNNDPDWAGQATFLICEEDNNEVLVSLLVLDENGNDSYTFVPSEIYQFNWSIGQWMWFQTPDETNTTGVFQKRYSYGIIDEIKEGDFGGVSPLKYVDLDGKAPDNPEQEPKYVDTNGGRIMQGIGITEWNDGECLLGPVNMYKYLDMWGVGRERHYRSMLVHFERDGEVLYDVWPEKPRQPLSFLEGNPIWEYKYEHIPRGRILEDGYWTPNCWIDTGEREYTYYFLGGQKEIDGKTYTMMGEMVSRGEDITFNRWYPVREENGIVYTITDSLPGIIEQAYNYYIEMPYLQEGNECILYNFGAEIGDKLDKDNVVKSFGTYQLMDGTECRVLKTGTHNLCEKIGYWDDDWTSGLIDPLLAFPMATDGSVYAKGLNAYYQDGKMLYKRPDAKDGLCVNDTCWTREDAEAYACSYKTDPRQEEVMSFIRQLQGAAAQVSYTAGQMATIVLPTEPDASKGKYYRLDRIDGKEIVFEQELHPQAHIPYIIVPSEDFSIELSAQELAGLRSDTVSVEGISFIGSFVQEEVEETEGFYIDIIDTTPDCTMSGDRLVIGALHAYLLVPWDDPYDHGGTKSPTEKMQIVLHNDGTGIKTLSDSPSKEENIYDLSGKIVNRKSLNSKSSHGIYIKGNRKIRY